MNNRKENSTDLSRRTFLRRSARGAALTALFTGLPRGWVGSMGVA